MNRHKRRKLDKFLIQRDGYECGLHVGGCGTDACSSPEADLDHIFPQAFFRDTKALNPREYDRPWNLQRMHKECNREAKGGFVSGFPVFKCACHWLQIRTQGGKYALELSYRPPGRDIYRVVVVPYGKFDVGHGTISDPKGLLPSGEDHVVVGFIQASERGMTISSVTTDPQAAFSGARKSFSFVGKSKRGTIRRGENSHLFPLLAPSEVTAFNAFEKHRVDRGGAVDDGDNLIATFNSEVLSLELEYDELASRTA